MGDSYQAQWSSKKHPTPHLSQYSFAFSFQLKGTQVPILVSFCISAKDNSTLSTVIR